MPENGIERNFTLSDSLSSIRRALRSIQSAERRTLRHKMDRYNVLSQKESGNTPDYDANKAKTTNDVIAETLAIAKHENTSRARGRFSAEQRLFQDASIVQPEVRSVWQQKIGMYSLLSDNAREQLQQSVKNIVMNTPQTECERLRDIRLTQIARWMVYMWCDGEGYDPNKHPRAKT